LRELYTDKRKSDAIESLLLGYLSNMTKQMTLSANDDQEQDPTVLLWLLYFISYHYMWVRDYKQALVYVNRAIEHTPTLIELYTLKGKIHHKGGDIVTAAKLFEEARQLDTADRAINAISALYQAKAGMVTEGEDIMSIFFKDCGYESTVHDNQCIWFESTVGRAHLRKKNYRQSLKEFSHIMGHLTNMVDDQYDYYLYSMRKFTLNAFEGLMKFNDGALYRFKPIVKATGDLISLVSKVEKNKAAEAESFRQIYEDYLKSEEYLKLKTEIETAVEDEEEYKKDQDPEGYHQYNELVSNKHE
jgi:N-alpha-acetyltransferase 15/16, NatA auxiliary subunit